MRATPPAEHPGGPLRSIRSGRVSVRDLPAAYGRAAAMTRAAAQDESNEKQKERKEP